MAAISSLAEYILGYTTPTGQKLARFGSQTYTINLLPPNEPINFILSPLYGYANMYFWHRFSACILPNTIFYEITHRGIIVNSFFLSSVSISADLPTLIEVTQRDPLIVRITNLSGVNQFFEGMDCFLVISSPTELTEVQKLVRTYGGEK